MKKKIIIAGIAVVVIAAAIIPRFTQKKPFAQPVAPPVLSAENPVTGDIKITTDLIGTIEPSDVVYIYPKASGDITAVNVKSGDIVTEGQILCEIDTKQVETAKNTMDNAEVSLAEAQSALNRMKILYEGGTISAQSYEDYQNSVKKAQIQYDTARIAYQNQLEYSSITAPISGKVESSDMELHDTVSMSDLICVISGEGSKVISFNVTERIKKALSAGDTITINKDDTSYEGIITEINSMADASTGLFKVKAAIENYDDLSTGTMLQLAVISDKTEQAMTIPVNSVYFDSNDTYVYTFDNGTIHKVSIEPGIFDSQSLEVLSGLTYDDLVVTTWSSELYEGAQATLKTEAAE